jgi:hypothetical protein
MFCDNGLAIANSSSMYYIAREDAFAYNTSSYANFTVTSVQNDRHLHISDGGNTITITHILGKYTLELRDMYNDSLLTSFEVDHGIASTGGRMDIPIDRLYRTIAFRSKQLFDGKYILECPFQFTDVSIADDDCDIHIAIGGGNMLITIKGSIVGMTRCTLPNYIHIIRLAEKQLKSIKQMWGSTMFILGHVHELSEIGQCHYLRLPGYGTYTMLLPW